MKKTFLTLILSLFVQFLFGQSSIELQIQLLTPDLIAEATLDKEPFFEWVNTLNSQLEAHLKAEKGNKEVMVVISLHKDKDAIIEIGGRPRLDEASMQSLREKLLKNKSPRTLITDFSFLILAKVNKGCKKKINFFPAIVLPEDRVFAEFKELDLAGKQIALMDWVQNDIIPIIVHYETSVSPEFEGVVKVGKMLEEAKYLNSDIQELTENNPDYWRATMEMEAGNQLIPFTKSCMHIAKGEYDKAKQLLFIISFFSQESSLPKIYLQEINAKLELISSELGEAILEGIAMHDAGKYQQAVSHYEKLLETSPHSAWLNYELYFSKTADWSDIEKSEEEWNKSKKKIYWCDPMYPLNSRAKTGKEGYLLFKRQEIKMLFQTQEQLKGDVLKYADIALDLENYGFAAQLYWLILSAYAEIDYDNRDLFAHFLYCLDKLGDKENIKNFDRDFSSGFKEIEQERRKLMEESPLYNAFKDK